MTKNTIILVIILLYLAFAGMVILYLFSYTNFSEWLALSSLILSGVIVVEKIADWLAKMMKEPRLRIVGSSRMLHGEGSEGEYLDIYLLIKNTGGEKADDCDIQAVVKGVTKESFFLNHVPFSLNAGNKKEIHFQQIIKNEHKTRALMDKSPNLGMGRIFEYEITFSGANLEDKKKHRLKLDLSSWENIKVVIDC